VSGFRYLLALEPGGPADPAMFVTGVPDWRIGDTFVASNGQLFRILAIRARGGCGAVPGGDRTLGCRARWRTTRPLVAACRSMHALLGPHGPLRTYFSEK